MRYGKNVTPTKLRLACEEAGLTVDEVRAQDRRISVAQKRFHVYALLSANGSSLLQIGKAVHRDHTTVMHGLRRWKEIQARGGIIGDGRQMRSQAVREAAL